MNKILLGSMVSLLCFGASAQVTGTRVPHTTFGISAGVNWNNINGKTVTGAALDNKLKTGFHGGVNLEVPVGHGGFYLQPGVEYRLKGSELSNGNKLSLSYVEVPVNFIYKPALGKGTMLLGFGPYLGLGINGMVKSADGVERDVKFHNAYSASEAEDLQFKKMDAGANFMAGYELRSKLSFALKAQLGLVNINPDRSIPNDETRYRNTGFGLSLGYRL